MADVLEGSGVRVVCNRTGANLDSGVSTALLHAKEADWGVFESDELWLKKMTPQLKPTYVLLLNLFRDQLDRCGEIDRIQDSIVEALAASPETILVFNADDPLCATLAKRASELPWARTDAPDRVRVSESMGLAQNTVSRRHDVPAVLVDVRVRLPPIRPAGSLALPDVRLLPPFA